MKNLASKIILSIIILFVVNLLFISVDSFIVQQPITNDINANINPQNITHSMLGIHHAHAASMADKLVPGTDSSYLWVFNVWDFCLSLINIGLIGFLIFLGVVNILHLEYDTYQMKKILMPIVIGVILANFSLFICRAIIEFSNALSNTFFEQQTDISNGILCGLFLGAMQNGIMSMVEHLGILGAIASLPMLMLYVVIGLILAIIIFLILLILSIIMFVRQFVILVLAAVSPLAFIFMILPPTKGLFQQWWKWFLRWVFMGPVILLVLKVASIIGETSCGASSTGGGVFSFIAIIGLMVLAIMVPWIIGGQVLSKIPGLSKGPGGIVSGIGDKTHFGRAIKGKIEGFKEHGKAALEQTENKNKGQGRAASAFVGELTKLKNPLTASRRASEAFTQERAQADSARVVSDATEAKDVLVRFKGDPTRLNPAFDKIRQDARNAEEGQNVMRRAVHSTGRDGELDEEFVRNIDHNRLSAGERGAVAEGLHRGLEAQAGSSNGSDANQAAQVFASTAMNEKNIAALADIEAMPDTTTNEQDVKRKARESHQERRRGAFDAIINNSEISNDNKQAVMQQEMERLSSLPPGQRTPADDAMGRRIDRAVNTGDTFNELRNNAHYQEFDRGGGFRREHSAVDAITGHARANEMAKRLTPGYATDTHLEGNISDFRDVVANGVNRDNPTQVKSAVSAIDALHKTGKVDVSNRNAVENHLRQSGLSGNGVKNFMDGYDHVGVMPGNVIGDIKGGTAGGRHY